MLGLWNFIGKACGDIGFFIELKGALSKKDVIRDQKKVRKIIDSLVKKRHLPLSRFEVKMAAFFVSDQSLFDGSDSKNHLKTMDKLTDLSSQIHQYRAEKNKRGYKAAMPGKVTEDTLTVENMTTECMTLLGLCILDSEFTAQLHKASEKALKQRQEDLMVNGADVFDIFSLPKHEREVFTELIYDPKIYSSISTLGKSLWTRNAPCPYGLPGG